MTDSIKLVLQNGRVFSGRAFGASGPCVGEIVFNTSMVGYQETLSDPAYCSKIVVMTYPIMGQYGITDEDFESKNSGIAAIVVRDCCETPSNFRSTQTLCELMEERGIAGLEGPDTRMLTKIIRDEGSMMAAIVPSEMPVEKALELIANTPEDKLPILKVGCTKRSFSRVPNHKFDVVAIDCGIKHGTIAELNRLGCNVTIVPHTASVSDILGFKPDGLIVCGGPGDPRELQGVVDVISEMKGRLPVCGTSLGFALIALAYGAKTFRMSCGIYADAPVRNLDSGRIFTACHSCRWGADISSVPVLRENCRSVDGSLCEGFVCPDQMVSAVLFNPEGAPGPRESGFFEEFVKQMSSKEE